MSQIHSVVGACCESILISNTNMASSPLLQYPQNPLDIFMGLYRQAGEVNGGPVYRRVGNLNMWLARFVPLSSFTKVWLNTLDGGQSKDLFMYQIKRFVVAYCSLTT